MSLCGKWFCVEVVRFRGHKNVRATHETTLEITKDRELTPRGDCIVGISADKALRDFSSEFKNMIRRDNSLLITVLASSGGSYDVVIARGSSKLTYSDERKIIIRRSSYTSGNTAGIKANKAARDLSRDLIRELMRGHEGVAVFIVVVPT